MNVSVFVLHARAQMHSEVHNMFVSDTQTKKTTTERERENVTSREGTNVLIRKYT